MSTIFNQPKALPWNTVGHILSADEPHTLDYIFNQYDGNNRINYDVREEPLVRVPKNVIEAIQQGIPFDWTPTRDSIITSHKATIRTEEKYGIDTTLGIVGNDYQIVQNDKALEFMNFIEEVSGQALNIETFGALGHGEKIFITATLGEDMFLNPDDAVKNYLIFTTGHNTKSPIQIFFSPIRVICSNSLAIAIKGAQNKIMFKHTKNVGKRVDFTDEENRKKAIEVFAKSVKFKDAFLEKMNLLKAQNVNAEYVKDFAHYVMLNDEQFKLYQRADKNIEKVEEIGTRVKNQIIGLQNAIENSVGQQYNRSTKLRLLNGLTTMFQNDMEYRSDEAKLESLVFDGTNQKKLQKAFDYLAIAA